MATNFSAEALCELIVDLGLDRLGDLLDLHIERRRLALEGLDGVLGGERHVELTLLAGLGADQAILEARDEAALPENERGALGRAVLEGRAIDLADEVHGEAVALPGGTVRFCLVANVAFRDIGDRLIDGCILNVGNEPRQLQRRHVGDADLRQHLERHVERQVGLT